MGFMYARVSDIPIIIIICSRSIRSNGNGRIRAVTSGLRGGDVNVK